MDNKLYLLKKLDKQAGNEIIVAATTVKEIEDAWVNPAEDNPEIDKTQIYSSEEIDILRTLDDIIKTSSMR